jgi:intracellular sulfur oxidation DsrE/DsrF family protein
MNVDNQYTHASLSPSLDGEVQTPYAGGVWENSAVEAYGKILYLPHASYQPQPDQVYQIVFAVSAAQSSPDSTNPSLEVIARAVNLYTASGVPLKQLKFVSVAYGDATPSMLADARHEEIFGTRNPNLPLIKALRAVGVDVTVCGQAVAKHNYPFEWLDSDVTLTLSAITTLSTLEHKGYSLIHL